MVSSTKLALFAFLRSVRLAGLGRNLRAFILRCLLLWPRTLRSFLRKIWPWHSQTSSKDEKKTNGDAGGPSSTGMVREREEYVVVCASQDLGGGGEPSRHARLGSSDAEQPIPLEEIIPRTPSVPHSLSSSLAPPSPGPSMLSATRPSLGSPRNSASSLPGSIHDAMELFIHRSDTPVTPAGWTHPHAAGIQFTSRSRSRSRQSSLRRRFSRPSTPLTHDIETRLPPIRHSQGSPEGSSSEVSIDIRTASSEDTHSMHSPYHPRLPPIDDRAEDFPTRHQIPSAGSVNSSAVSSQSGTHSFWMSGANLGAGQGGGIQDSVTSPSTQDPRISFPEPSVPPISTPIPTANEPNSPHQPRIPSMGLMTSEQVSRYSKKGDV